MTNILLRRNKSMGYLLWGIALLLGLGALIFIIVKASVSSFTHDESYTYLHFVHKSFKHILAYADSYTNNHLLNTMGMKYSELLFGCTEAVLRLPNLLLFAIYLVFSFLLLRKSDVLLAAPVFILLFSNSVMLDYFGLARGYGMSIGFMMLSLYHLLRALESSNKIHLVLFSVGAVLATLSNFTLLNFYIAGLISYNIILAITSKIDGAKSYSFFKSNKTNFILFIINFIALYEPVRRVIKFNDFDFGGKANFYDDTINALVRIATSNSILPGSVIWTLKLAFFLLILFPLFLMLRKYFQREYSFFNSNKELVLVNLIILGILMASVIQHYLFGTDYMRDRFALFLFPLFVLNIGYIFYYYLHGKARTYIVLFALLLALASSIKFIQVANVDACAIWGYDMNTKSAMMSLNDYHLNKGKSGNKVKLGVNWLFEPTANFYRQTMDMDWLDEIERFDTSNTLDYYYEYYYDLNQYELKAYDVIVKFNDSGTLLVKNSLEE